MNEEDKIYITENANLPELVVTPTKNSPEEKEIEQAYLNRFKNRRLDIPVNNTSAQLKWFNRGIQSQRDTLHNSPWMWGLRGLVAAPAAVAAPLAGSVAKAVVTNPYTDALLTSSAGAHGIQSLANGKADWTTALEVTPMFRLAKPVQRVIKPMVKETADVVKNFRYSFGRPQVPEGYFTSKPQVRTRIGDVEVDNPNLLYHLDRGNSIGAFSNQGAYIKDGILFPGITKKKGQLSYSWWNKGKPYATSVKGQPMTRLMTTIKDTPGMLQVRNQNYPIGQWTGSKGFVLPSEYVSSEGVNVSGSTYVLEPTYGWKRVFGDTPAIVWTKAKK